MGLIEGREVEVARFEEVDGRVQESARQQLRGNVLVKRFGEVDAVPADVVGRSGASLALVDPLPVHHPSSAASPRRVVLVLAANSAARHQSLIRRKSCIRYPASEIS